MSPLRINQDADPNVHIPIEGLWVRVAALQDADHKLLAWSMGLTLCELEDGVRSWAQGEGLPYNVLLPVPDMLEINHYKGGRLVARHQKWFFRNRR